MVRVVAVVDDELLGRCEVAFDAIHPRRVGRGEDQLDVVAGAPLDDFILAVSLHVVQDDVYQPVVRISPSDGLEESQYLLPPLPLLMVHPQTVFVDIVSCQEMANPVKTAVGGSVPDRTFLGCPRGPGLWLDLDRSELVETDYGRSFWGFLVERLDAFFLAS